MGSSNIFSFFFWKKSVKFSCIDLWSILVEYMCKTILQITSWHPGEKTWDEHQKQTKTHTSYNHINLKQNHPSILSPQNTQHWLQKCTKFILSSFPPKSEELWSNFHWLSRHFLLVQKLGLSGPRRLHLMAQMLHLFHQQCLFQVKRGVWSRHGFSPGVFWCLTFKKNTFLKQ